MGLEEGSVPKWASKPCIMGIDEAGCGPILEPWCTAACIVPSPIKNSFLLELCRSYDDKTRKWMCTDIEVQRYVVRSIAAFLDSISGDTLHHPLVKDVPSVQQSPPIQKSLAASHHQRSL
ncbi:uncharacterized protein LOC142630892 [Castanea sativa]|uniref:uncharacterized protein LOC142630892 n=1 Tax=Castanea sativa TaxID=21020 RepID=UPI003F64A7AF